MNEGLPATLQPRRSSASFLDPVPRSMPLSLSITRSPLFLLSLSLSPSPLSPGFSVGKVAPTPGFLAPVSNSSKNPRKGIRRRRCCRCDDATVGETRPKKAPVQCSAASSSSFFSSKAKRFNAHHLLQSTFQVSGRGILQLH